MRDSRYVAAAIHIHIHSRSPDSCRRAAVFDSADVVSFRIIPLWYCGAISTLCSTVYARTLFLPPSQSTKLSQALAAACLSYVYYAL